ncbi:UNVERIFIED_CONTAM: hypothetical protein K2H54_065612 [Gekko kuhli]
MGTEGREASPTTGLVGPGQRSSVLVPAAAAAAAARVGIQPPLPVPGRNRRCGGACRGGGVRMGLLVVWLVRLGWASWAASLVVQECCTGWQRARESRLVGRLVVWEPGALVFTAMLWRGGLEEAAAEEEWQLQSLGLGFAQVQRCRLLTFHGPGLLVAYLVLDLRCLGARAHLLSLRAYVAALECLAQTAATALSLPHARPCPPYTGIWLGDAKLCAISEPGGGDQGRKGEPVPLL